MSASMRIGDAFISVSARFFASQAQIATRPTPAQSPQTEKLAMKK